MSGHLLSEKSDRAFARHETFHLRYGWLQKAVAHADGLTSEQAVVTLGVGKNMVTAIRYWGQAFGLISPEKSGVYSVTPFGKLIFGDEQQEGLDPWIEDPGTLWLLHAELLTPVTIAPTWWLTFNHYPSTRFSEAALSLHVKAAVEAAWPDINDSSIDKDVDCLLRMYGTREGKTQSLHDLLDSPLRELGILSPVAGEAKTWRFAVGYKPTLTPAIVAWSSLRYMSRIGSSRTCSLAQLATDLDSPGRVFKLNEIAIGTYFEEFQETYGDSGLRIIDHLGMKQLHVTSEEDIDTLAIKLLRSYYGTSES